MKNKLRLAKKLTAGHQHHTQRSKVPKSLPLFVIGHAYLTNDTAIAPSKLGKGG